MRKRIGRTTHSFDKLRVPIDNDPRRVARVEQERRDALREHLEYSLGELRKAREMTQVELARVLDVGQPNVSRIEQQVADARISSIREYVEALGGRLELTAVFDDERIPLAV